MKTIKKAPNPKGKGGFGDNPQNRNAGYWKSEDSIPFNQKMFLRMTEAEFESWKKNNPPNKRTKAQTIAYNSIKSAEAEFNYHKDLIDRTSGTAKQFVDHTNKGEKFDSTVNVENEWMKLLREKKEEIGKSIE